MKIFFEAAAKSEVKKAVQYIEGTSSAEIVVSVSHQSATYVDAEFLIGFVVSLLMLLVLTFSPAEFPFYAFPIAALLGFIVGVFGARQAPVLKSLVTPRARKRAAITTAAKVRFVDQGITRTKARSGILVFVSTFEQAVAIVPDLGVPKTLERAFLDAQAAMESALALQNLSAFVTALNSLAKPLEAAMPRSADDENELPDDVAEAADATKAVQ
jgi:putative membrane protein